MAEVPDEEKIVRAREAEALATFPAFAKAMYAARAHYTNMWINSDPQAPGERETAYYCQKCLSMIEDTLKQFVADGKAAERALERARNSHGS